MQQRGRKSAEGLTLVRVSPKERVAAPDYFSAAETDVWREIVASKPADWFSADNLPLLEHYCSTTVESRRVASQLRGLKVVNEECLYEYERLIALQSKIGGQLASLATKMRLTQQSRYGARAAATASDKTAARKPWEFGG